MVKCSEPECVFYPAKTSVLYRISPRDEAGVFLCGPHLQEYGEDEKVER